MSSVGDARPALLIVDDDESLQRALGRAARLRGVTSLGVSDGRRAIEIAAERQPMLILLDVHMPGIDGFDVLQGLKRDARTQRIAVFMYSGRDAADDRERAFNLGAEAYFEKPFDLDLLFATIVNQAAKRETDAPPPQDEVEWEQEGLDASYAEIDRRQAEALTLAEEQRASERRIRASVSGRAPVLVIEDDQSIRQSLCNILEDEGVPTMSASNGREALELLRTLPVAPALILLDLMMPVMDGWEFRKALAGDASLPKARVVVMSARARDEALGPVVWLQKPLALEQLLATVHEQARRSA